MIEKVLQNGSLTWFFFASFLVVVSILALNHAWRPTMDHIKWREELYHVKHGDNLWKISGRHCPDHVDTHEYIKEIQALNRMQDHTLYPGSYIVILTPAKEGER